jgi:hypothetical protein
MNWISVSDSSAIEGFGYDEARRTLDVKFKSGQAYTYFNIPPKVFDAMQGAPSKGHFVTEQVKGKYEFMDKRDVGRPKRSLIRDSAKPPRWTKRG